MLFLILLVCCYIFLSFRELKYQIQLLRQHFQVVGQQIIFLSMLLSLCCHNQEDFWFPSRLVSFYFLLCSVRFPPAAVRLCVGSWFLPAAAAGNQPPVPHPSQYKLGFHRSFPGSSAPCPTLFVAFLLLTYFGCCCFQLYKFCFHN